MYTVRISVRELVAFVLRTGDLKTGFVAGSRQADAIRRHQSIQGACTRASVPNNHYTPEVPVAGAEEDDGIRLEVAGRMDGLIERCNDVIVQEIKTTTESLDELTAESHPLYWAQAQCYACLYARERGSAEVGIHLVYAHLDTRDTRTFERSFTAGQLEEFFRRVARTYIAWARVLKDWTDTRDASLKKLVFPFDGLRPGQDELMDAVDRAVAGGTALFAQAPTGIGKTMATLFPAVKAVGDGDIARIFYATAKAVTRTVAENALAVMRSRGMRLKTITLTAKEKICFIPGAACTPEECPYAKGYYDRLRPAVRELFAQDVFDRPAIEACARKHALCPFEFSLDVALWADCVICDYNYLFDPRAYLRRFFADDTAPAGYLFLVDEAHNLIDRAREMFSAVLTRREFRAIRVAAGKSKRRTDAARLIKLRAVLDDIEEYLAQAEAACAREIDEINGQFGNAVSREAPALLLPHLTAFTVVAGKLLEGGTPYPFRDKLLDLYFAAHHFLNIADGFDERYRSCAVRDTDGFALKLFCVDPSRLLGAALRRARSAVFFSATLTPLPYFQTMLGGGDDAELLQLGSPFPAENLCVLVDDGIATTYRARALSYDRVAQAIATLAGGKIGNYIAYFPSYAYLGEVRRRFIAAHPGVRTICQEPGMSDAARARFLDAFSQFGAETLVGFAVMGGMFGEGIDLAGERLSGVVIVGVGLPQVSLERAIIREHFEETLEAGFAYAYIYPGMNKVLQAAGRVIRTETDRGVILLLDERFSRDPYRTLMPPHWRPLRPLAVGCPINEFWSPARLTVQSNTYCG